MSWTLAFGFSGKIFRCHEIRKSVQMFCKYFSIYFRFDFFIFCFQIFIEENDGNFRVSITDNLFLCANQNHGWTFQTFTLNRIPRAPLPPLVRKSQCQFPEKIQKKWEGLEIRNNSMKFRDLANLYSSEAFCIQSSFKHSERFLVYFQDQW